MFLLHFHLSNSKSTQVYSSLQDSSQYSGRSQKGCSSVHLDSSSEFQILQLYFQTFGKHSKFSCYNWYYCFPHVPKWYHY